MYLFEKMKVTTRKTDCIKLLNIQKKETIQNTSLSIQQKQAMGQDEYEGKQKD